MALFGWLRRKPASAALLPESKWSIELGDTWLCVRDANGAIREIAKAEVQGLAIETNDSGPWGADLWWLAFGPDGSLALAWPQGATGEQAAIDWAVALPDFDHETMIKAMTSTDNATFVVWNRHST